MLTLGGVRVLIFPTVAFEGRVDHPIFPGLTHAVYESDDFDADYRRMIDLGATVLIEPAFAKGGFGSRRLAFFQSPGGVVFEIIEILSE
jgi:hypothetical protein